MSNRGYDVVVDIDAEVSWFPGSSHPWLTLTKLTYSSRATLDIRTSKRIWNSTGRVSVLQAAKRMEDPSP